MVWGSAYYVTADGRVPTENYLDSCPRKVEASLLAVLEAVRMAPPPTFSGGGKWEAMHGTMRGYYEIRATPSALPNGRPYDVAAQLSRGRPGVSSPSRFPDGRRTRDRTS